MPPSKVVPIGRSGPGVASGAARPGEFAGACAPWSSAQALHGCGTGGAQAAHRRSSCYAAPSARSRIASRPWRRCGAAAGWPRCRACARAQGGPWLRASTELVVSRNKCRCEARGDAPRDANGMASNSCPPRGLRLAPVRAAGPDTTEPCHFRRRRRRLRQLTGAGEHARRTRLGLRRRRGPGGTVPARTRWGLGGCPASGRRLAGSSTGTGRTGDRTAAPRGTTAALRITENCGAAALSSRRGSAHGRTGCAARTGIACGHGELPGFGGARRPLGLPKFGGVPETHRPHLPPGAPAGATHRSRSGSGRGSGGTGGSGQPVRSTPGGVRVRRPSASTATVRTRTVALGRGIHWSVQKWSSVPGSGGRRHGDDRDEAVRRPGESALYHQPHREAGGIRLWAVRTWRGSPQDAGWE